jgi:hypothetical protein
VADDPIDQAIGALIAKVIQEHQPSAWPADAQHLAGDRPG